MGNLIHYMDASTLSWLKIWCSRSKLEPLIYSLFMTALLQLAGQLVPLMRMLIQ